MVAVKLTDTLPENDTEGVVVIVCVSLGEEVPLEVCDGLIVDVTDIVGVPDIEAPSDREAVAVGV